MSSMKKNLVSALAVAAIAVSAAVPAFAETFDNGINKYHIRNNALTGYNYLNMEGSGAPYDSRNVTVYSRSSDEDQIWHITNAGSGKKVFSAKTDAYGRLYTLNINHSNNNCNVYRAISDNDRDSVVVVSGNMASFTVMLKEHNLYLYALTDGSRDVRWGSYYQTWSELA